MSAKDASAVPSGLVLFTVWLKTYNISLRTGYRYRARGLLPCVKLPGGKRPYLTKETCDAFLASMRKA